MATEPHNGGTKDFKRMVEEDSTGKLNIFLINVEALATDKGCKHVEHFMVTHDTMLVIDESTTIKNPKAKRTKNLIVGTSSRLQKNTHRFPNNKSSTRPIFTMLLEPRTFGYSSFYAFQARYATTQRKKIRFT